jgi:hypothetical protein
MFPSHSLSPPFEHLFAVQSAGHLAVDVKNENTANPFKNIKSFSVYLEDILKVSGPSKQHHWRFCIFKNNNFLITNVYVHTAVGGLKGIREGEQNKHSKLKSACFHTVSIEI